MMMSREVKSNDLNGSFDEVLSPYDPALASQLQSHAHKPDSVPGSMLYLPQTINSGSCDLAVSPLVLVYLLRTAVSGDTTSWHDLLPETCNSHQTADHWILRLRDGRL